MGVNFIDHGASAAAIHACQVFSDQVSDLAAEVKSAGVQVGADWQGQSYNDFMTELSQVVDRMHAAAALSGDASGELSNGLDRAIEDERREEERRRKQQEEEDRRRREAENEMVPQ